MLFAGRSGAQTLRGVVVDERDMPVPGAVLLLLDPTSTVVGRALSNGRGEYRLTAPGPGAYRVRTLRIGYRPVTLEPMTLAPGAEVVRRLVLTGVTFSLDTVRVMSRNSCRAVADSGAATFAVWEQVRTALNATELSGAERTLSLTTLGYERALDPQSGRIRREQTKVRVAYAAQPWRSRTLDSLHRFGYVVTEPDHSTVYYAPGLDVLLSDMFLEDHCFRLVADGPRVGMAFEPAPDRRRVSEIKGTIWLDRASAELRSMEFGYANLGSSYQEQYAGGGMDFVRMRNGVWAISRWDIRMPVLEQRIRARSSGGSDISVSELRVAGGEVVLARMGRDTLWSQPPRILTGTVRDSASGDAVAGARVSADGVQASAVSDDRGRFRIAGLLPGDYSLDVWTTSLDSVGASHRSSVTFTGVNDRIEVRVPSGGTVADQLCGNARTANRGIVMGRVRLRGDSTVPAGTRVDAEWDERAIRGNEGGVGVAQTRRRAETRPDRHGQFWLCGIPIGTPLVVRAESDSAAAVAVDIQIPTSGRMARVDLALAPRMSTAGSFAGTVVSATSKQPIAGAEVRLPGLAKTIVRLDTVAVVESALLPSFEEHRRLGRGHFMTRAQIEPMEGIYLASVLAQVPGIGFARSGGGGSQAFVQTKRSQNFGCRTSDIACLRERNVWVPESWHKQGARIGCYSQVYIDGMLMNPQSPTEPFDVNTVPPSTVEALEYYSGAAQTPLRYAGKKAVCGVLVLWLRRAR